MDKLENIQTKDRIADMLRKQIMSGKIKDGQELAQEQLAEILEVSRMPVREALQVLELEGLLIRLPNRHMQVAGPNEYTVFDNMRIVAVVEAEIALILMGKGVQPDDVEINDNWKFHNWFSSKVDNPYLRQTHRHLLSVYPQYTWEICKDNVSFAKQNERILLAINSRNVDAVRGNIREYYDNLAHALLARMKEEYHE